MSESLGKLRAALDEVDDAIVAALAKRQELVDRVMRSKRARTAPLRDVAREEAALARIVGRGRAAGLSDAYLTRLFREVMDHALRRQQEQLRDEQGVSETATVAYLGDPGSYSELAARKHFAARASGMQFTGCRAFPEILDAVASGRADFGLLPIENTTAGSINEAYDLLAATDLAIVGEEIYKVEHCLLAAGDVPVSHIRRIYSHTQALTQCSEFLRTLHDCQLESVASTATGAARLSAEQDLSHGAIASAEAAHHYGLHIIKRDISNHRENYTRFVIIATTPREVDPRIAAKTSLLLATRHEEGALLRCLNTLHEHRLNLTKLESRPRPNTPWEYLFYVDFEGTIADPNVQAALRELTAHASFQKVLGSYPARTTRDTLPASPRTPTAASPVVAPPPAPGSDESAAELRATLEKKPYKLVSRLSRATDSVVRVGAAEFGGARPVMIAGPCSVESRAQIFAAAQFVKDAGAAVLRGGCFKPRTSPYDFQGLGYEGVELLVEAGRAVGLPVVTEVLHPADVAKVAESVDLLQLGARNMQNFSLLKEIGRVDRPVLLKRGMSASIDEWLAAAEYILAHGNQQVILCERGIRTFETATRNTLDLTSIPVVRERTHLPVIVDPSHACGQRRWVTALARAALAAGAQGLMVEVHPDPAEALSDGPQALTFELFKEFMSAFGR